MKMLIILYLVLVFCGNIKCDESNESRYIDLLPEEEKEQFLQKIARRIFEEAEVTDDQYKQSREIPDDQLNEHSQFVEKILREESANLRKNTNKNEGTDKKSEENLRVKPLFNDRAERADVDAEDRYVDLTLRQGSRKKRKDNFEGEVEQTTEERINVDIKYDTEDNKVIKNGDTKNQLAAFERLDKDSTTVDRTEQSSFEDIQVKNFGRKGTTKESNEIVSSTNLPQKTQMASFDAESAEHSQKDLITSEPPEEKNDDSESTTEGVVFEKEKKYSQSFTESIYEPITRNGNEIESTTDNGTINNTEETQVPFNILSQKSNGTQQINDTKRAFYMKEHEDKQLNMTVEEFDAAKENLDESTPNNYEYNKTSMNTSSENDALFNESYNSATTDYKTNIERINEEPNDKNTTESAINYTSNASSTNYFESNSSAISEEKIKVIKQIQTTNIIKENLNRLKSDMKINEEAIGLRTVRNYITNMDLFTTTTEIPTGDVVKVLRQRLLTDNEKIKSDSSNHKSKPHYHVYDLPPFKEPFILKRNAPTHKNEEEPHYVPIYNYSANNAYFTAQNRYGPNLEDSSEKKHSDMLLRSQRSEDVSVSKESYGTLRDVHRKFRFVKKQNPNRSYKIPNKVVPMMNQQQYYPEVIINPDDYLDTDYYFGRTNINAREGRHNTVLRTLPDSSDENHPRLDSIRNFIRSVRKILFGKNVYGYVPPPVEKGGKIGKGLLYSQVKREGYNGESVDSYMKRKKHDDQSKSSRHSTRIGYVKYNNVIRDLRLAKRVNEDLLRKVSVIKYNDKLFFREDSLDHRLLNPLRGKITVYSKNNTPEYFDTILKVLMLTNEADLIPTLNKMRAMNISYGRSGYKDEIAAYVEVMDDILETDPRALDQYNWLETTVEIQSAINRLIEMTEQVQNGIYLHPADLGLLKYTVYLYQTAKTTLILKRIVTDDLRIGMIPRNKKRIKMFLKEKGLLNRVWLFKRDNLIEGEILNGFKHFLLDLQAAFYDLHSAIKHIAIITKYQNQAWFENIQRIYMRNDRKHLLELVLHLSANRLFGLIEESAANGAEVNYVDYMKENELDVGRSVDECVFVLKLLDEIKYLQS